MTTGQFKLLQSRRFLPLFITQFLGAFNDNVFKNALLILITYDLAARHGLDGPLLVTMASGLFILPFFLFSATAGQLADRYERSMLVRRIKLCEIGLALLASVGLYLGNTYLLFAVLFLLGAQSTFFGPIKYSLLPDHLRDEELIGGNGLIEMGTFISILLGTIAGGLLIRTENGTAMVSTLVCCAAFCGWLSARRIPTARISSPQLRIRWNFPVETFVILRHATQNRIVFCAMLGISWFWLLGATFLSQFPNFGKLTIGVDEQVVTLFLTFFSIGIGIGSLLCNKLLHARISAKYVPAAIIGLSLFTVDLYFISSGFAVPDKNELMGLKGFFSNVANWRLLFDLTMIAICGGIYIIPLYSLVQHHSDINYRSRTIAGVNIMNALFMVVSALATSALLVAGFTIPEIFLCLALANIAMIGIVWRLPK